MAEGTYEYECMRAELLGIEKPDYEEFIKKKGERLAEEEQEIEHLQDAEGEEEQMKHVSGGLDELNSILQVTQRKINRFKASCSSLTSLIKFKLGTATPDPVNGTVTSETSDSQPTTSNSTVSNPNDCGSEGARKSDLARALDNNLDKIDTMIEKAENAQYSMASQTKEMKRFLK